MRKLINDPRYVVREMLEGMADLNPEVVLFDTENILMQAGLTANHHEVAIISGGGGGHEPAHAGYVGHGMLHAVVSGDVFTSPSSDSILAAIRAAAGSKGVLLIVKNYTGDRLNFGLAAEMARSEGIAVEIVIVGDDIALRDSCPKEQSRGIAGTVLVHKIAGALAAQGADLATVAAVAREVADSLATMGVALDSCTIPAVGKPSFELAENEVELGLGIHGEKGMSRISSRTADELVAILLDKICANLHLTPNEPVVLLINSLGGTPPMELAIVTRQALAYLRQRGINVVRAWSGNFMTALEMPGCSLTLLPVNQQWLECLDFSVAVAAWNNNGKLPAKRGSYQIPNSPQSDKSTLTVTIQPHLKELTYRIAAALERSETLLTELDSAAGDGDLGLSMSRGAAALRQLDDSAWINEAHLCAAIGNALRVAIAGSSGPFYATGLLRAARYLHSQTTITSLQLAEAFVIAVAAIAELGGAKINDRTMLDALEPAATKFKQSLLAGMAPAPAWQLALQAGAAGTAATAQMLPKLGRASYIGERALGYPDAGATAVMAWLNAI